MQRRDFCKMIAAAGLRVSLPALYRSKRDYAAVLKVSLT